MDFNVEGEALLQTIMGLVEKQIALDIEEVVISGDTNSADADLALMDGLIKLIGTHTVDGGATALSDTLLNNATMAMPVQFLNDPSLLHFLVAHKVEKLYRKALRQRVGGLAEAVLTKNEPLTFDGSPITPIVQMPTNIGTNSVCSSAIYIDPKNIQVGLWQEVKFATQRDERAGCLYVIPRLSYGVALMEEIGAVEIYNLATS
jgi:hypothetical protein